MFWFAKEVKFSPEEITLLETSGFSLNSDQTIASLPCPAIEGLSEDTFIESSKTVTKTNKYYRCKSYLYTAIIHGFASLHERDDSTTKKVKTIKEVLAFFGKA